MVNHRLCLRVWGRISCTGEEGGGERSRNMCYSSTQTQNNTHDIHVSSSLLLLTTDHIQNNAFTRYPPHNIEDKMIILSNPRKSEWEIQRGEEREKKRVPCGKDLCLHPPHSLFSVMTPQSFFIEYWNLLINKQARMVHDVTLSFLKKKKKLEELERIYIMCLEDYIEKHLEGFFCFTIF